MERPAAPLVATDRVFPGPNTSATQGRILWDAPKSLWWFAHLAGALVAVTVFPHWDAIAAMILLAAITICAGHSVGMHRLLIHRSFTAPPCLERLLVWLGTLVGMAGPFGMIRAHDMRDWHQRQSLCPPHPSHAAGFWRDAWWQMHCRFQLDLPPDFVIEPAIRTDRFYRWLERTWMLQQLPLAALLFVFGGWAWVFWGIPTRILLLQTGHWAVGHFAHRTGQQGWRVEGLPVQGYNLPGLGLLTFGENWHGNHHAFPHSARLGVEPGQLDPGFWLILALEGLGLAHSIRLPDSEAPRAGLTRLSLQTSAASHLLQPPPCAGLRTLP